jgi:class 3 adenylate cyclase
VINRLIRWLYARLGAHYWLVVIAAQVGATLTVALATIAVIASYFRQPLAQIVVLTVMALMFATAAVVVAATWKSRDAIRLVDAWKAAQDPPLESTVAAWQAATSLTFRQYRRNAFRVSAMAIIPVVAITSVVFQAGWSGFFTLMLASVIPAVYGTFLSYSVAEFLAKPVVEDIAGHMPDDFPFTREGLPVARRLRIGLPVYTITTGLVVAAIIGDRDGARGLLVAILVAVAVGLFLSTELTVLLSRAITTPIADVREAMLRVRSGDYSTRVPVTSSDELGELAHDFNLMASGLAEREAMRSAFGTYVDKEVVGLILSGEFPDSGVEVEISILFCDVRGFTSYAESVDATDVVDALNRIFTAIVPVIERHGGHVDKFLGDGLLAYFGVPESHPDHADRAVGAARELVAAVNDLGTGLSVGVGVNTGRVVAGAVGGAGRLNFSIIGDAVNVAARVEAATRETGDDILLTAATRDAMRRPIVLVSHGSLPLKGKSEPLELLTPADSSA